MKTFNIKHEIIILITLYEDIFSEVLEKKNCFLF